MLNLEAKLSKYADLAVEIGVNVQPGQILVVNAPVSAVEFVRLITAKAYAIGASLVKVNWSDESITRQQFEHAAPEVFTKAPTWYAGEMTEFAENGAAILTVIAEDPDALKGIDPERIANYQKHAVLRLRNTVISKCPIKSAGVLSPSLHKLGPTKCSLMFRPKNVWINYGKLSSTLSVLTAKIRLPPGRSILIH